MRFDIDLRFSHVVVTVTRPGKWFDRENTLTFQFLGWATVVHAADGGGWRAGIEPMLLVNGLVVPSSLIATAMEVQDDERVVVTQIVPSQVAGLTPPQVG